VTKVLNDLLVRGSCHSHTGVITQQLHPLAVSMLQPIAPRALKIMNTRCHLESASPASRTIANVPRLVHLTQQILFLKGLLFPVCHGASSPLLPWDPGKKKKDKQKKIAPVLHRNRSCWHLK